MATAAARSAAPYLVLLVGVLAASSSSILIRQAQAAGVGSIAIAFWRMALASLVLLPIALTVRSTELRGLTARARWIALLAGTFLCGHFVTWTTSLEYTSVASSAALVTTNPIWVALATVFLLREPLPRLTVIGIGISLIGCALILWADLGPSAMPATASARQPLLGNLLALSGALLVSAYLLIGRSIAPQVSLLTYVTLVYGAAALVLLIVALATGAALGGYASAGWLAIVGLAVGPQLIGHTSFNWALRRLSPTFVALSILGEPVGSALLAALLLDEVPPPTQLSAFGVLLGGILVAALGERRAPTAPVESVPGGTGHG